MPSMPSSRSNRDGHPLLARLKAGARKLRELMRSSRGRDIGLFLVFVCVSYCFWLSLSLNEDSQREVDVRLQITDVPEGVTFISEVPDNVHINVRDKGTELLKFNWGGTPTLKIPYGDFTADSYGERLTVSQAALQAKVGQLIGAGAQVMGVRPDSLSFLVTDLPGRRVAVSPQVKASASALSVLSGPVTVSPDSVTVYSTRSASSQLRKAKTRPTERTELTDTVRLEVLLEQVPGTRMVPDRVTVTIPVEPLISRHTTVDITLVNEPSHLSVVTFPAQVRVNYMVPMSQYNATDLGMITVHANYARHSASKVPLQLATVPEGIYGVTLAEDSVDYLVEPRAALTVHGPKPATDNGD